MIIPFGILSKREKSNDRPNYQNDKNFYHFDNLDFFIGKLLFLKIIKGRRI